MSGGTIAIIVIVCLFSASGGVVFLIFLFKQDSRLRKMFNYQNQPTSLNSFENVAYDKETDPSQLNKWFLKSPNGALLCTRFIPKVNFREKRLYVRRKMKKFKISMIF